MPLYRRIPKRGFQIYGKRVYYFECDDLNVSESGTVVTPELLKEKE